MFRKLASEALGISDIGRIIPPADYDKVDADDYVLHEDGERIYFLIKSKKDEYCFTNRALIHVDGDSAISSKRTLRRYEYYKAPISGVALETAGTVDLDKAVTAVGDARPTGSAKADEVPALTEYIAGYFAQTRERYVRKDYGEVFERYINN